MPFDTIAEARAAGFPVTINKVDLTPKQVNHLVRLYDAIKDTDAEKPMAVAIDQFKKLYEVKGDRWVAKKAKHADDRGDVLRKTIAEIADGGTSDFETEPKVLFKPGKWKNWRYSVEDCKAMAQNAAELAERGMVAQIMLGHDTRQTMAKILGFEFDISGLPSLGEAKIWWDDKAQAVMTKLQKMPEKLADLVRDGRYKTVSAEVRFEWYDDVDKKTRENVIPFVSLLGLEWPGMQGMSDQLEIAGAATHSVTFAGETIEVVTIPVEEIEPFEKGGGDEDMELKELQAKYDALVIKVAELEAAPSEEAQAALLAEFNDAKVTTLAEARERLAALLAENKTYKDLEERAKKEAAAKIEKAAEKEIDETLAKAVKKGVITVAEKDAEKVHLMSQDYKATTHKFADAAGKEVEGTQLDQALALIHARKGTRKFSESGAGTDADAPGSLDEETPQAKKVREAFGYDRDEKTGLPVEPKKADEK